MDNPLAALDPNVKKRIFNDLFLTKLADKTRVLVTHSIDYLPYADQIVYLKNGQILA